MEEKSNSTMSSENRQDIYLKMTLLSDTIFGNGMSVPGEADIAVLTDKQGFPYYKGSTFKGVFREEMERLFQWDKHRSQTENERETAVLFGEGNSGTADAQTNGRCLVFSDFVLSPIVRKTIYDEIGDSPEEILDCLTNMRAFTSVSEEGTAKKGSLRHARCVNKGLIFHGSIRCCIADTKEVKEALRFVKWIGTMRNRGFGNVRIEEEPYPKEENMDTQTII